MKLAILIIMGAFWILSGLYFFGQMSVGHYQGVSFVHQDLAPSASKLQWRIKTLALMVVGLVWVHSGVATALGSPRAQTCLAVSAIAIVAEQLMTLSFSPKHWKSYSGVLLGIGFGWLVWSA